ncbi:polymeric immunoglobulin receptor-like isoform X4, partial [Clarias magur]
NEENKDSRRLIFTISPAQPPTTITDASQNVYDNTLLPTSPFDSAVYSTAEFLTILPDQNITDTAQLPTDLPASSVSAAQQSGGESVTGPVYAA